MDGVLSSAVVRIVASYVGANPTSPEQLRDLIQAVRAALGSSRQQPEEYRAKWGLPKDYPMIASNYSEARSSMARAIGLGQKKAKGRTRQQTPA